MNVSTGNMSEEIEFKNIKCKFGILSRPHGSALLCQGETSVIAGTYGPVEAKVQKILIDKAQVEVFFRPKAGLPGIGDRLYEGILKNTCETALLAALYPRASVLIIIQELHNSGGLMSCAVNASCLALLDSGVDLRFLVGAVSCALDKDDNLHVDPGPLIVENAQATFDFVFENIGSKIVTSYTSGCFTVQQYEAALERCRDASSRIFRFYKDVTVRKFS